MFMKEAYAPSTRFLGPCTIRYIRSIGISQGETGLHLSTLLLYGNKIFTEGEWGWDISHCMAQLQPTLEEKIQTG